MKWGFGSYGLSMSQPQNIQYSVKNIKWAKVHLWQQLIITFLEDIRLFY